MATGWACRARGVRVPRLAREVVTFAVIGAATTVVHLAAFALLRQAWGSPQGANAVALALGTIVNTAANRRWTFAVRCPQGAARAQAQGFVVFAATLAFTSGSLWLLHALAPHPPTWLETLTVAVATLLSTAAKFLLMKRWMFAPGPATHGSLSRSASSADQSHASLAAPAAQ